MLGVDLISAISIFFDHKLLTFLSQSPQRPQIFFDFALRAA